MIKGTPEEVRAYKLANYHKNKNKPGKWERREAYRQANKETIKERERIRRKRHKEENSELYQRVLSKARSKAKEYRLLNPEAARLQSANKQKINRKDPFFKFKDNLRTRVRNSFSGKGFTKRSKAFSILGCTYQEFRDHIESLFEPWMNWENYGNSLGQPTEINKSWDLDHIIPICTAKTEEDAILLNHYSNIRPLCSYVNRYIKHKSIPTSG